MKSSDLQSVLPQAWARAGQFVAKHPRSLSSVVILGLAGFGATAFGIAPRGPEASLLAQTLITESVEPMGIDVQLERLAEQGLSLYRSDVTRTSDTADSLLRRLNVDDASAAAFLRQDPVARKLLEGRSGKSVQVSTDAAGTLVELVARYAAPAGAQSGSHFTRLSVVRRDGKLRSSAEVAPMLAQQRLAGGTIQTSLFAATDEAGVSDALASQLAEILSTDIDFHRELRKGDTFSMIYETLTADGEAVTWGVPSGRVVAAEFVNKGRRFSALWFKDEQGKGAYYDFNGKSRSHSFLASPLEFSRTTSGFAMRMHPILNQWKQHNGVDYAAPRGTPVRVVGDGVVEFAGQQNGYGNIVQIKHDKDRATVYAHLSRIDVEVGQRVEQGQHIGAVGATGWATGPHLHFEFKIGGVHQDPLLMAQGSEAATVAPAAKAQFAQWAHSVRGPLDVAQTMGRSGSHSE
ncbi:MAG: peptidase M23 [Methylibium sp. NZG]|nr:MAG: peptidase M23 [Methylibium sp. NZG]